MFDIIIILWTEIKGYNRTDAHCFHCLCYFLAAELAIHTSSLGFAKFEHLSNLLIFGPNKAWRVAAGYILS